VFMSGSGHEKLQDYSRASGSHAARHPIVSTYTALNLLATTARLPTNDQHTMSTDELHDNCSVV
jgi:hypothetical protein